MKAIYLFLLFNVFTLAAFGQTGSIKGVIKDSKTQEPAIGANVIVDGTSLGAAVGIDGEFNIQRVPVGNYSITISSIGYATKKIENIAVEAGNATVLNTTLEDASVLVEGVTIQATRLTDTDISIIKDVREAKVVVSAISGAQISKTQDRDAAEVVRRIPGVTIIDNRFVNVRGLNDRYNSVWLNDAATPSTETDKKAFSFDIIPTQVIDRILVYKSPSPELPGDFAGGMVKIYTRTSMPTKNFIVNFSEGFRSGSTFGNLNYDTKSSTDFLGWDNGSRNLPTADRIPANAVDEASASHQFSNTYAIHKTTALPDLRFSVIKGSSFYIGERSIESVSLLNYSNTNSVFNIKRNFWDDKSPTGDYMDNQSTNQVKLGAMQNFGIRLNNNNKIEWRNLFNQIGTGQTVIRDGSVLVPYEHTYIESYQSRALISSQLNGKHTWADGKSEYTWTGGFSYTHRNDPDLKRMTYNQSSINPNEYDAVIQPGTEDPRYGGRFYQRLYEKVYSFTHNYSHKFEVGDRIIDLNIGNYAELKNRRFGARQVGYVLPSPAMKSGLDDKALKQLPIGEIFSPQYVGTGGFIMNENTAGTDDYSGENRLLATYASIALPIVRDLNFVGGIRAEYNIQTIFTHDNSGSKINPHVELLSWLPSANLSYNFTEKSLLRATYGRSLNRPEFREWGSFSFYDYEANALVQGTHAQGLLPQDLKVATIDNFDLRYEFYPSTQELFHFGVYYKNFQNPIERYNLPSSNRLFTFGNAQSAYVAGVEFDLRKNLNFLGESFFRNMSLVANASYILSQITLTDKEANLGLIKNRPLQGQSPYVINAGLYYQSEEKGISGSLTYNVFGARSILVGTTTDGSWGEMPRNTVDMAINYPINRRTALTFAVQNLINQPVQVMQDTNLDGKFQRNGNNDRLISKYKTGQYFNLGLKLTL